MRTPPGCTRPPPAKEDHDGQRQDHYRYDREFLNCSAESGSAGSGGLLGCLVRALPGGGADPGCLAKEMDGKLLIAKVNVDENQVLAHQFQVASIPTFLLFKGGRLLERKMGALPKSAFESFVNPHL